MTRYFQREIDKLKLKILSVGAMVEESVLKAVKAFLTRDEALAREVIEGDLRIDEMEVEVEEDCLKILALHQPVAVDLRFIIAVLKINNDLERIGDLGVSIAQRGRFLARKNGRATSSHVAEMSGLVKEMVHQSLDALVNMDGELAFRVRRQDDAVDDLHKQNYCDVQEEIRKTPEELETLVNYLSVSRYLERIADHTTNIAEDVIYMIDGQIVRHKAGEQMVDTENHR